MLYYKDAALKRQSTYKFYLDKQSSDFNIQYDIDPNSSHKCHSAEYCPKGTGLIPVICKCEVMCENDGVGLKQV